MHVTPAHTMPTAADPTRRARRVGARAVLAAQAAPAPAHTTMASAHAMAGAMQLPKAAARGPILWPVGISFVGGTLGAVLGGLWPSLIGGTLGWLLGEQLR